MKNVLSKLTKLDLREVWKHEALDFTNWVAENLGALSDAVGVDIKLIQTEASVGKFNVDILAEEDLTGRKIIIQELFFFGYNILKRPHPGIRKIPN